MPGTHDPAGGHSNNASPRRRMSRPLPFTLSMPSIPSPQVNPATANYVNTTYEYQQPHPLDESTYSLGGPSRPPSPSWFRTSVVDIHDILYAGGGHNREEVRQCVRDIYDTNATFENPATSAKGVDQIADLFGLMGIVPGSIWSEIGEICESSPGYDGTRLVVMSHTMHLALLPSLHPTPPIHNPACSPMHTLHRNQSFYSTYSYPYSAATPHPDLDSHDPNSLNSTTVPAASSTTRARWPLSHLFTSLSPSNVLRSLTTVQLKLHSRLVFNEQGRIILHEDVVGFKEAIEGLVPLVGTLYSLNRKGVGFVASTASRVLLGRRGSTSGGHDVETSTMERDDPSRIAWEHHQRGALGMSLGLPNGAYHSTAPPPSSYYHQHSYRDGGRLGSPVAMRKGSGSYSLVNELERRLEDGVQREELVTTSVDQDSS